MKKPIARRDFLKKGLALGGAGALGAAAMRGFDSTFLQPSASQTAYGEAWQELQQADVIVFVDARGNYYTKDGNTGQVTKQTSTTTGGIQEAIDKLRSTSPQTGGLVELKAGIYSTTSTISIYPGIGLRGIGQLGAFKGSGTCAIQPANSLNAPVIKAIVDPNNTSLVVFPLLQDFTINGGGIDNSGQDGIQIDGVNGSLFDVFIRGIGIFGVGGTGLNILSTSTSVKVWARDFYAEGCLQHGVLQNQGWLQIIGGYFERNTLAAVSAAGYDMLELYGVRFLSNKAQAILTAAASSFGATVDHCYFSDNGGGATPTIAYAGHVAPKYPFTVHNSRFVDTRSGGSRVVNHIVAGSAGSGSIHDCAFYGSSGAAVDPGTFNPIRFKNNLGLNPIGKVANPFLTNHLNYLHGNAAVPAPSTDYALDTGDVIVTAANSSNSDNAIIIKDAYGGNTVAGPFSMLAGYCIPQGYAINWGAFTGTAGEVLISWA